jgi:hypothetical protein
MSFLAPIAGAAARAVGTRVLGGVATRLGSSAVGRALGSRGMLSASQFAATAEGTAARSAALRIGLGSGSEPQSQSPTIRVTNEPISQMLGKSEMP